MPTTALFQAAEQVLPEHGYDAENAPSHIDRLIFKIGGQRSGDTLSDKFRAVLAGMNIQIEYIPSSPYEQSPAVRPRSTRLYGISDDETGNFDFSPRRVPHRRHSSVSRPLERLVQVDSPYELPLRPRAPPQARSASPSDIYSSPGDALGRRKLDFSDVRSPPLSRNARRAIFEKRTEDHGARVPTVAQSGYSPGDEAAGHYYDDEGEEREDTDDELPARPFQSHLPTMGRIHKSGRDLGTIRRDVVIPGLGDNKGLLESPLIIPNAHLHHSPRADGSDGFRGTSDTTAQTQDDQLLFSPPDEPPAENTEVLEAKLNQSRMSFATTLLDDAFFVWHATAIETRNDTNELLSLASDFDNGDIFDEVLDIWQEVTIAAQESRQEQEAAMEREAYVQRMEKRASRVYEIVTISTVLAHWQDSAREEADRTAVARRHLVRKRAFDGWRAQHIEDESKVTNFVLINALQKWGQVALHHEVRHQVAIRRHQQDFAAYCLDTMWKTQKGNTADEFWRFHAVNNCLDIWSARTREVLAEQDVAATVDERLLLTEVIDIWGDETEDLQYTAYNTAVQHIAMDCQRMLDTWQEQARLTRLLAQYNTNKDRNLQYRALDAWRAVSLDARRENMMADILVMEDPLDHWKNETQLRIFHDRVEQEEKAAILRHWYLEERLAWYKRYSETNSKRDILNHFLTSARQSQNTRVRAEREADYVLTYYRQTETFDSWRAEADAMWRHHHNANLICLYRTANPVLDSWRELRQRTVARDAYYGRQADRNEMRGALANVLDRWPGIAQEARRERMMVALRQFRRNYKVDLARSSLDNWWSKTADAVDHSQDAHALHVRHRRNEIKGLLQHWDETARRAEDIRQIAADAEVEVYCGMWQGHLTEVQENRLDAIDYDAEQTLADSWRKWEFQALQMDSKKRTVTAVRNRNDNRFCSQVLDDWHQIAAPDSAHDLQHSIMSRRSLRYLQSTRPTTTYDALQQEGSTPAPPPLTSILRQPQSMSRSQYPPVTPRLPVSQLGFSRVGGSARLASSSRDLGPMAEFDDDDSFLPGPESNDPGFMSTPTRWTGSARPLGYRPTTTPSAILASPYERELRQEYGQSTRPRVEFADIREESLED